MSLNLKEISKKAGISPGHRACAGCGMTIIPKLVLGVADNPVVFASATGCFEVVTTIYPYTSWTVPWIHLAFENAGAVISGVESAYRALKRRGKIEKKIHFVALGGDGGTYDIGLQSLSGAIERGHNFLYICYDNEGYMNTGVQRSGATPLGARTTTSPAGKVIPGKMQRRKNLTEIIAAHHNVYVAQASISHWGDFARKIEKALKREGPSFINVLSPCPTGWDFPSNMTVEIAKIAVETLFWPLYEVERGVYRINYKPKKRIPVYEWLKLQGRFKHILDREDIISEIQREVDENWNRLLKLEELSR
jgi:pyruvate ferredoxin oxidoreductase beta subunit